MEKGIKTEGIVFGGTYKPNQSIQAFLSDGICENNLVGKHLRLFWNSAETNKRGIK